MATATALTSFHALDRFIAEGEQVDAADPIVKAFPTLFTVQAEAPKPRKAVAKKAAAKVAEV